MYSDTLTHITKGVEDLKEFQNVLRGVPKWTKVIIDDETRRIMRLSNDGPIIPELIQAVIKANVMVLTNTPPEKRDQLKIETAITTEDFIHKCYIEVARAIFTNPFLMSTKFSEYEVKQNEARVMEIINKSIKEAIRKMLPMDAILKTYVGTSFEPSTNGEMSESDRIRNMLAAEKAKPVEKVEKVEKQEGGYRANSASALTKPADDRLLEHVANRIRIASESTRALVESAASKVNGGAQTPAVHIPSRANSSIKQASNHSPVPIRTVSHAEDSESINVFSHMDKANIEQVYGTEPKAQAPPAQQRRPNNFLAPYYKH